MFGSSSRHFQTTDCCNNTIVTCLTIKVVHPFLVDVFSDTTGAALSILLLP